MSVSYPQATPDSQLGTLDFEKRIVFFGEITQLFLSQAPGTYTVLQFHISMQQINVYRGPTLTSMLYQPISDPRNHREELALDWRFALGPTQPGEFPVLLALRSAYRSGCGSGYF